MAGEVARPRLARGEALVDQRFGLPEVAIGRKGALDAPEAEVGLAGEGEVGEPLESKELVPLREEGIGDGFEPVESGAGTGVAEEDVPLCVAERKRVHG